MDEELERLRPVVFCPECDKPVSGIVSGEYEYAMDVAVDLGVQHLLVKCPHCSSPFLCKRTQDHKQDYRGDWEVVWGESEVLYPRVEVAVDESIPKPLADSYLEACRTFGVQGYTSTAVMCRRVLEGICGHFEAQGQNLYKKLSDLKSKGVLDLRLYEWSDEALRHLGNDAAHDVNVTISKSDARDALDFTKAILEYLFVFAKAFERFKTRQEQRKAKPPADGEA